MSHHTIVTILVVVYLIGLVVDAIDSVESARRNPGRVSTGVCVLTALFWPLYLLYVLYHKLTRN